MAECRTRRGSAPVQLVLTRRALEDALEVTAHFGQLSGLALEPRP